MESVTDWLKFHSEKNPNQIALTDSSGQYSFRDFSANVNNLASSLYNSGIKPGGYIPVVMKHGKNFVHTVMAIWRLGAIPVPISNNYKKDEILKLINFLDSKTIISDLHPGLLPAQINIIKPDYFVDTSTDYSWQFSSDDPAVVIFTSGTTLAPKAVVHTFGSLYESYKSINQFSRFTSGDRFLASLPFHHIGGFMIFIRSIISGAELLIPEDTNSESVISGIYQMNPTIVSLVPTVLKRLVEKSALPKNLPRAIYIGGGPSDSETLIQAINFGYPIIKVYGSSETCAMISAIDLQKEPDKINSSGYLLPGNLLHAVDDQNKRLAPGLSGELVFSGESMFSCYLNDALTTSQKITGNNYFTGDYGFVDDKNLVTVEARKDDIIISGGENINPMEIENVLNQFDNIQESCVVGLPDREWGQVVTAFIVPRKEGNFDDKELLFELKKILADYKIPKKIFIVGQLPRNESGKIERSKLRNYSLQDVQSGKS